MRSCLDSVGEIRGYFERVDVGLFGGTQGDAYEASTAHLRNTFTFQEKSMNPKRTCILSFREVAREASRSVGFEFEDIIAEVDDVDFAIPEQVDRPFGSLANKLLRKLNQNTGIQVARDPKSLPLEIEGTYDLMFITIQNPKELSRLDDVPGWRSHCKIAVCLIEEYWAIWLQEPKISRGLEKFDYVFTYSDSVPPGLSEQIGKPCFHLPPSLNTELFCPYPDPPERHIDVYSMGRRAPETHAKLMELAGRGGFHYLFDSAGMGPVIDHVEHRRLLSSHINRTRFFIVFKAKVNKDDQTRGEETYGPRYLEGAASGAVLLGERTNTPSFKENYDWEDVVIDFPFGSERIGELIAELDANPDRLAAIRRTNIVNSLRRHDWVYRWKQILETVGMVPLPALQVRVDRLEALAKTVEDSVES